MNSAIYRDILDDMATRRAAKVREREALRRRILAAQPDILELERAVRRHAHPGDEAAHAAALERLSRARSDALLAMGLPGDAMEDKPECTQCGDSGYHLGRLCTCVRNRAARQMFGSGEMPDFSQFDVTIYPESPVQEGVSQRAYMAKLRDNMLRYCAQFPNLSRQNVVFCGSAGLGKTYLMDCMGMELMRRGFSVNRVTAYQLNGLGVRAMRGEDTLEWLITPDALLIDDLGSEPLLNKVTLSTLFNVLNERISVGRPFIITTNLTPHEIADTYGDRVYSRMMDKRSTQVIPFLGADVRR